MKIQARIMGVIEGALVHREGSMELPQGITLKAFFKKADKALGWSKDPCFKPALKGTIPPAVMINGNPVSFPEGFSQVLFEGDDISVVIPMAGG